MSLRSGDRRARASDSRMELKAIVSTSSAPNPLEF
jgi:hypothetical protein